MDLSGIISITGRPGLYRVIAQGKNSIIVESLTDGKRFPAYATDRISALDDISIYTYDKDVPLKDVFTSILKKEKGQATISHKEDISVLQKYMTDILPDYDQERVYASDIKKLFQWFNMLLESEIIKLEVKEEKAPKEEKEKPAKKAPKETAPKKVAAKKEESTGEPKKKAAKPKAEPAKKK